MVDIVEIDCSDKQRILQQVYERDQKGGRQDLGENMDNQNLAIITSLLRKCGMPTLAEVSQEQMMAIWLVIQHSDKFFMKKYLPGSQVMDGKLWDLIEPEYVNKRRKEVGLDPIEDYLKIFDIEFNIPQKEE